MSADWELSRFRTGDRVEVRSEEEILATLDASGRLEGMPFMPEMLAFCGKRARVAAIAHKTCQTANTPCTGRRLSRTVHLEGARCDGSAHGGCDAACNLFWRDEWLRPVPAEGDGSSPSLRADESAGRVEHGAPACTRERLFSATRRPPTEPDGRPRYSCQATELIEASEPLPWWDVRQYVRDVLTGNHGVGHVLRVLTVAAVRAARDRAPIGYRAFVWLHRLVHRLLLGREDPTVVGRIPRGEPTPVRDLGLRPGQWVRIRSKEAIAETLDTAHKNRGLYFDEEEVPYCGSRARVTGRVERILNEATGEMLEMKTPSVRLDGVVCRGEYSECRLMCPRAIPSFWREAWLEPLDLRSLQETGLDQRIGRRAHLAEPEAGPVGDVQQ